MSLVFDVEVCDSQQSSVLCFHLLNCVLSFYVYVSLLWVLYGCHSSYQARACLIVLCFRIERNNAKFVISRDFGYLGRVENIQIHANPFLKHKLTLYPTLLSLYKHCRQFVYSRVAQLLVIMLLRSNCDHYNSEVIALKHVRFIAILLLKIPNI